MARRLATAKLGGVYCSDLQRAASTAEEICAHHHLEPRVNPALREVEIFQRAPQDKRAEDVYPGRELTEIQRNVMRSRKNSSYPHCEDVPTFRKRVVSAIDDILASHVGERVAVVCHGGVIHAVLGEILETSIDYLFSLEHSSISTIRGAGDRKAIFTVNDYAHLQGDERWSS